MSIDMSKTAATGAVDGFKNYDKSTFSVAIPTQSIPASRQVNYTATTTLDNTNSVSQVQVNYGGLETAYRVVFGSIYNNYAGATYQLETIISFTGTTLSVTTYAINLTGSPVTIPDITVNCRAFLFLAPF